MNSSDTRWVPGTVVVLLDNPVDLKKLVRDTDYALLEMMGKIKHRADGFPAVNQKWPNISNWPFKH
ncbi:hypothetical protein [Ralstonia solanacearum]|uniref:hypothetical protein n=1 Tax=Ralstonia solanacearum TaxID=305 RepID=UPI003D803F18